LNWAPHCLQEKKLFEKLLETCQIDESEFLIMRLRYLLCLMIHIQHTIFDFFSLILLPNQREERIID
jgi:hypothetical protein